MRPKRAVASFDSASTFQRVLAQHLHGKGSPALGLGPAARAVSHLLPVVNHAPPAVREALYIWSGWSEAVRPRQVDAVDTDAIAEWACEQYPRRKYPAVFIGSSSGALAHLAALAGVPWLPQTFLVPVRHRRLDPDDPVRAMNELARARAAFVAANPGVAVHHMHDANQDRLMIRRMSYFRYKYRTLPDAYARFLRENLAPGGTVVVVDCTERWPTTEVGPRQVFQHGAVGDATPGEYAHGGPRVAEFLASQGAQRRAWNPPPADGDSPEAEWGFDAAILPELETLCRTAGFELDRLAFSRADELSGPVAELYRSWYTDQGQTANRLLVSCFAVIDVHVPLTHGLVPYWTLFGTRDAHDTLDAYLGRAEPYHDIHLGLFSHGTHSIGLARTEDWDGILAHARGTGAYCGVDTAAYPQDFASNGRFHRAAQALTGREVTTAPWEWTREQLARWRTARCHYTTASTRTDP